MVLLLPAVFQDALVPSDQIVVAQAARATVREAASGPDEVGGGARPAQVLEGAEVEVTKPGEMGEPVVVVVQYISRTTLPVVGPLFPDPASPPAPRSARE